MSSADAIDQEILNDLRNGKKVEPKPELKPIVDAVVSATLAKAKEQNRNCGSCNHFRSDLDNKHNGLCTLGDFPVSWKDDDNDDCPDFWNDWIGERSKSITKTLTDASKMLKERRAGNPNSSYIVSEDVYKFLQEAEKKDSNV